MNAPTPAPTPTRAPTRSAQSYYNASKQGPGDLATRMVEIGQAMLVEEGLAEAQALTLMRAIVGQVFTEWGSDYMYIPKDVVFSGLTERDQRIWAAWNGRNEQALCRQFDLSLRMLRYVLAHCRRWHKENTQPQLPGLVPDAQKEMP